MLQNEGFCQLKEQLPQTWRLKCLSPGLYFYDCLIGPVPWQRSVFPMYFHIFHIFVSWYTFLCSKVFSKTCPRLLHSTVFHVCGFLVCSSVFKPIEANTCLLLYNWAVNVNRVITNLAQNVFVFSLLRCGIKSQRGVLIRSHLQWKKSGPDFAAHFRT